MALGLQEGSRQRQKGWLESMKTEFQNGPLASNVVFALVMTVLERLVDMEFECPCKGTRENGCFVATFFIIPGILAFVLMASVQGTECSCDTNCAKRFFHCLVPAFVWILLLVFDGSYIACGMTDWSGRYVTADKASPLKWCEPENGTLYQDRLKKSQDWYVYSQWAAFALVLVLALVILIIKCIMNKSSEQIPPGQTDQAFTSGSAVPLRPVPLRPVPLRPLHTNTPETRPTDI